MTVLKKEGRCKVNGIGNVGDTGFEEKFDDPALFISDCCSVVSPELADDVGNGLSSCVADITRLRSVIKKFTP